MKRRNKFFLIVGAAVLSMMTGCAKERALNCPEFLTKNEWQFETDSCMEILYFGEDGAFSYYEACGNPVGDSDLYEEYSYDEETGMITVYPYESGMEEMQIEVLRYDDESLLLKFDDEIKEFCVETSFPFMYAESSDYIRGYSSYVTILHMDHGIMITAPSDYDSEEPADAEIGREEKLAEDVEYYKLHIETMETEEGMEQLNSYAEISAEDAGQLMGESSVTAFIWYNMDVEIEKVVFFEEVTVSE